MIGIYPPKLLVLYQSDRSAHLLLPFPCSVCWPSYLVWLRPWISPARTGLAETCSLEMFRLVWILRLFTQVFWTVCLFLASICCCLSSFFLARNALISEILVFDPLFGLELFVGWLSLVDGTVPAGLVVGLGWVWSGSNSCVVTFTLDPGLGCGSWVLGVAGFVPWLLGWLVVVLGLVNVIIETCLVLVWFLGLVPEWRLVLCSGLVGSNHLYNYS